MKLAAVLKSSPPTDQDLGAKPSGEELTEQDLADPEMRGKSGRSGSGWLYPAALALGTLTVGLASIAEPVAAVIGSLGVGSLCVLRKRLYTALVALAMLGALGFFPAADMSIGYWLLVALLAIASVAPIRIAPSLLRVAPMTWAVCILIGAASIAGLLLEQGAPAYFFAVTGCVCLALLGAGLARHLAMVDARILAWGEQGLEAVTRDLLLGRVTSGMLHDLSQPLNVISMANGNLGYLAEHLEIDDRDRQELLERIDRIATHTDNAAAILSLFRWFGRTAHQDGADLTVRGALSRAAAATRSNVRYHGVEIELDGTALDLSAVPHHGRLEMMAVAALLSALAAYGSPDGERTRGRIVMFATVGTDEVAIEVHCFDEHGAQVMCKPLDNATLWLIEQVAHEAGGEFRCFAHRNDQVQFEISIEHNPA